MIDPSNPHDVHQPRERPVPCMKCHRDTWNHNARCDVHQPVSTK